MLSATSQALLAAARSGSDTPAPPQQQKVEYTAGEKLFMTKRWVQVPKEDEGPEETYLVTLPGRRKKEEPEEEQGKVQKRTGPPMGGRKKVKGNRGRKKKVVEISKDVEMVDVDAATRENAVVVGDVAKEMERQEEAVEKVTLEINGEGEGERRHDIPPEATPQDVVMEIKEAGNEGATEQEPTSA